MELYILQVLKELNKVKFKMFHNKSKYRAIHQRNITVHQFYFVKVFIITIIQKVKFKTLNTLLKN